MDRGLPSLPSPKVKHCLLLSVVQNLLPTLIWVKRSSFSPARGIRKSFLTDSEIDSGSLGTDSGMPGQPPALSRGPKEAPSEWPSGLPIPSCFEGL